MTDRSAAGAEPASRAGRALRLSFEFFPPRSDEGRDSLRSVAARLASLGPDFCSCTYGAGGSTRDGTRETIRLLTALGIDAAPHLSIGGDSRETVFGLLDEYRAAGVRRIVALRGDLPSGLGRARFVHNAEALVRWIREHSGDHFHVEVAAYPETHPDAASPADDLAFFARKVAAGANGAITQYFYNPHAYVDFVGRCRRAGIDIPIVPGIMPITNFAGLRKMADTCGATIPGRLVKLFQNLDDDPSTRLLIAATVAAEQCLALAEQGVKHFHFYTLNRDDLAYALCMMLGVRPKPEKKAPTQSAGAAA